MKALALNEGSFSVDISKTFLPFDPAIHNPKDRPASLFIYVQPFLIETQNELIILDTGLGFRNGEDQLIIHENIRKAGFQPEDVNLVLMSHLHFDHSGGMINKMGNDVSLSFPNAEYIIQRGEWEAAYSKPSRSYKTEIFDFMQRSGSVHFVEGSGKLSETISYELTGGHCEYHQVFLIKEDNQTIFFGGDILPEPEQLLRKFMAKYDFDGRRAMELRQEYGVKAAEGNWECLFYHAKSKAISKVGLEEEIFRIL
ncbi:MBL fold metallo-hydrolase [Daejeonella sp.]|uniref:MBL fold metallo-hydrolase n=1 Tax=Daejeonella sp. TaxID=2805397 RepID=UPI0039838BA5